MLALAMDALVAELVLLEALQFFAEPVPLAGKSVDDPADGVALGGEEPDASLEVAPAGYGGGPARRVEDEERRDGSDHHRGEGRDRARPVDQRLIHGALPEPQGGHDPVQPLGKRIHRPLS